MVLNVGSRHFDLKKYLGILVMTIIVLLLLCGCGTNEEKEVKDALQGDWHYADMSSYPNYVVYQISFSGEKAVYMAMTAEKEYLAKEISTYTISNGKIKCD